MPQVNLKRELGAAFALLKVLSIAALGIAAFYLAARIALALLRSILYFW